MDNVAFSTKMDGVVIIDQTLLPNEERTITLTTIEEMYDAIYKLRVRGAPAIGIFASFCLYVLANKIEADNIDTFISILKKDADYLNSSRPTAVNLSWALSRMLKVAESNKNCNIAEIKQMLYKESVDIKTEDIAMCKAISEHGLSLIKDGDGILTHCNAGPLATSKYGTALGPILLGVERGINFKVFADETRPLLQGARLTSYELYKAGVDVTLICDNMAAMVMKDGKINACFVGCDRVAANGDTANKIGTLGVAILAKHYNIPFYVFGPTSTIDLECKTGNDIKIELRDQQEIKNNLFEKPTAPEGVKCYNPSFDVTDHSLITAIITQKGICRPPYTSSIAALFE
ncbi:MAG: S-methyl-5-thioribose-1-phosphate isomerase [Defluviitaleaceae bacterium]|nr:S-methyl-5-thioribose-1-phosphate isomerase [Defluviitaleaceae bacterium]